MPEFPCARVRRARLRYSRFNYSVAALLCLLIVVAVPVLRADEAPASEKLKAFVEAELAWAVESEWDSVNVKLANRLAASDNAIVQRVGVRVLRRTGDETSIPYLVRALDADDKDTQMSVVVGLSRITGKKALHGMRL